MSGEPTIWIMMARDLSGVVRVQGVPAVAVAVILDAGTGLIRGVGVGESVRRAGEQAARGALSTPAGPLPPTPPAQVVYAAEQADGLLGALTEVLPAHPAATLVPATPSAQAEEVLDSLVAHLSGRSQPETRSHPAPAPAQRAARPDLRAVPDLPAPIPLAPLRTARLRVVLRDVTPAVVRVVDVPTTATLPELHAVLQVALGWTDSHLHEFEAADGRRYGLPDPDFGDGIHDESAVLLRDLSRRFVYRYDFGDGWEHDVEVIGSGGPAAGCLDGEGACPPEDCGGVSGYADLRAALADPSDPDHAELADWATVWSPNWADDERLAADRLVRLTVGQVPASVRLVLDAIGESVRLTKAGRLPRSVVRAVQEQRPGWAWSDKPASLEEDLLPLAALHDVLRQVGLLRLARGVLTPTKAAADDVQVVRRLRRAFDPAGFDDLLVGVAVAVLAARGGSSPGELAAFAHPWLGRWAIGGRPVTPDDVATELGRLRGLLEGLDLVQTVGPHWLPGPAAEALLPRATALASLLRREDAAG